MTTVSFAPGAIHLDPPATTDFAGLTIGHAGGVLVPREWTSLQSRWARELLEGQPAGAVLELCCGAGHIGLAATAGTARRLVQVDLSSRAAAWAHHNAVAHGRAGLTDVRAGDVDDVLAPHERFALVLADPPYLRSDEVAEHPDDPHLAIDGGADGTFLPRRVLTASARHLLDDGAILLQCRGRRQLDALAPHADRLGLGVVEIREVDADRAVALLSR